MTDPTDTIYTVTCTDTNPYGTWQCEFQEHTWIQVHQPGELVRLVALPAGEAPPRHEHARVVTTGATNTHPATEKSYAGYNRLHSLLEWLETEQPEGTVLIMDSDFVFRAPIERTVTPGHPVAQEWYNFGNLRGQWAEIAATICPDIHDRYQRITWPMLIHTQDLLSLMPRWRDITAIYRKLNGAWESDMIGLIVAAAEQGITFELDTLGAWMNWPEDFVRGAPIIHYCQPVEAADGTRLWYKQGYRPWTEVDVDPDDAALDYCRDLLRMLQEFIALKRASASA